MKTNTLAPTPRPPAPVDERIDLFAGLVGVLHAPNGSELPEGASPAVLMAAPLGDEMRAGRRALVEMARALARTGRWVFRFDYHGTGDSPGGFAAVTLARCREDIERSAGVLRGESGAPCIDLLGVRLGASLCLQAAGSLKVGRVCAVAPLIQGAKEFRAQLMRQKLRQKMTAEEPRVPSPGSRAEEKRSAAEDIVDIDGLAYSQALIDELQALDLAESLGPCRAETLLFQVGPRKTPAPEIEALAGKLGEKAAVRVAHRPPFWARLEHADVSDVVKPILAFLSRVEAEQET